MASLHQSHWPYPAEKENAQNRWFVVVPLVPNFVAESGHEIVVETAWGHPASRGLLETLPVVAVGEIAEKETFVAD